MQQRNKMIRLATHHFFQMGKFLFPLLCAAADGRSARVQPDVRAVVQNGGFAKLSGDLVEAHSARNVLCGVRCCLFRHSALFYAVYDGRHERRLHPAEPSNGRRRPGWEHAPGGALGVPAALGGADVAVYVSYGVYHWETALYNLPGARVGTSKLGFSVLLPDSPWAPPANDLYLTFVRTPFLQMFYPRHLFFVLLSASFLPLPVASCVYLALSFYGRRWWAAIPAAAAWASLFAATSMGESSLGQWDISACIFLAFEVAYMAACTVWMLGMAYRLCRKSLLD